ncbi:hypothetical protein KUH32_14975 [Thalassococcus sp. CAU 1522]|uniref:Lipoprotein n=1 Tax=Thalassococcus arenae TaxID=2851652 RepID=A0ABS6NAL5_9RHOB|nr:hypothetical protein [Thalassococcus arenae]MBV2361066.1 hypothetical protein [Thalassococcus arenae]
MKVTALFALFCSAFLLAACEPPQDRYPITGQECGPDDPVTDMDAADCVAPIQ